MDFNSKSYRKRLRTFKIIWYLMMAYACVLVLSQIFHNTTGVSLSKELASKINTRTMYVKVLERFDFNLNMGNVESGYLAQRLDKKDEKIYLEATPSQFKVGDNLKVKVQRIRKKNFSSWTAGRFTADIKVYALKEAELASVEKEEGEER